MKGRICSWVGVVLLASLMIGGCHGSSKSPDELAAVTQRNAIKPTVGGPHQELIIQRQHEAILAGVQQAFKETGVSLSVMSEPKEGTWLLGKSLAGRQVLVEILPITPGRFVVRITVDGGDLLAMTLLEEVKRKISDRIG